MTRNKFLDIKIAEVGEEEIDAHFHLLPDSYFVNTSKDEITQHVKMINKLLYEINQAESIGSLKPVVEWNSEPEQDLAIVNVVTWDRAGLFHKLAGALNIAGYNILSAEAISRNDNIAIDTFYVRQSDSIFSNNPESVFEENLSEALVSNENLYPKIQDTFRSQYSKFALVKDNPIAHSYHPQVNVYQELSLKQAIVETQAPDTPGLLYQIAHQLHSSGFDITTANISTNQGIAIDSLNFRSATPNRVIEREELTVLRDGIRKTLQDINPFT